MSRRSEVSLSGPIPLHQVDAFTDVPFRGNPAAVCLPDGPRESSWMQAVAAEMNLAETAFVWREGDAYRLRWFTPTVEVPLCGHATLASAHVLWRVGAVPTTAPIAFETLSGRLVAAPEGDWIRLDFPALPPRPEPCPPPAGLLDALAIASARVHEVPRPKAADGPSWLVELESEAGIDEDPVTGSSHCSLAPFWAARLGRSELVGVQLSARNGTVRVRHRGERVDLLGRAVTVLQGDLIA